VIPFSVPEQANVSIIVYNILGQQVRKLIDATMMPGAHHIIWNGDSDQGVPVSSGIYIVRLNSVNHQLSQKVVLLK
jgi:flagellar hook assembly protein FlgD